MTNVCGFTHRPVNDLAWLLLQEPLFVHIDNIPPEWLHRDYIDDALYPWLYSIDQNPSALLNHLKQQRSTRLGIYVEQLLSFYFEQHPRFKVLAKNLQVNNAGRTLGEFDFIIYDHHHKRFKHIEVALKFYLGQLSDCAYIKNNSPLYNWHQWVGPNQKDTLGLKLSHLINHQLCLSQYPEGADALRAVIGDDSAITSRLFFTGRFYFPAHQAVTAPLFSNKVSQQDRWFESDSLFNTDNAFNKAMRYCLLPRQYWLSRVNNNDIGNGLTLLSGQEMLELLQQQSLANINQWHLAGIEYKHGALIEKERFFVLKGTSKH
ncbi:MAG: DUF1853 family protein [Pseudomonadota bacterium]